MTESAAPIMDCAHALELLPWLVNGTLAGTERDAVVTHLRDCAACRRELEATALAWAVFGQHVPTDLLVAHALGDELPAGAAAAIEHHLARCAECSRESGLIGEAERLDALAQLRGAPDRAGTTAGSQDPSRRGWRWAALAAGLLAVVGLAGWLASWRVQRSGEAAIARLAAESEAARRDVEARETDLAELRRSVAALEGRLAAATAPVLNPAVVELVPTGLRLRGGPAETPAVLLPAGADRVTLVLASEVGGAFDDYALEVRDVDGALRWRGEGLRRQTGGAFAVELPAGLLAGPRVRLVVLGRRGNRWIDLEAYDARFQPSPSP